MGVSVSSIRSRLATRVGGLTGWKQSEFMFEAFSRDPSSVAHLAFAVGMGKTEVIGARQRVDVGAYCRTPFTLRFTARVKPKDGPESVDTALDAAQALINRVMDPTWPADFQILFVSSEHTATDAGDFIRHDVVFHALHQLALQ